MSHESSKNISPKQMKLRVREKVVQEILQSEKDYVRHLKGTYYLNYILYYATRRKQRMVLKSLLNLIFRCC